MVKRNQEDQSKNTMTFNINILLFLYEMLTIP